MIRRRPTRVTALVTDPVEPAGSKTYDELGDGS
jgi:hypothetical protein